MLNRERVRQVFAEAAELAGNEVAAYLDRACGSDATLRDEVESLLAIAARRPAFLGSPTAVGPGPATGPPGESAGMTIGRYRLLEEIGQGGFGSVYMAEQSEPVRRRVAVKIIKLGMDTRAVIARFEAERQALALMDHANIARVLDAGATESGRPYFVMELVKGDPITTYCDRNNLSISERLGVFVQVCHAVQHAHSKGVIHRDIKPGNVLVATEDGRPHAKVIDFGIAKATQRTLTEKTVFTDFRQFIGTPEYMSPEQADGSLNIDTRTDVYSLGVLLYELITGATPFDAKSLRSEAFGEIQRIIREVEPPKPSTRLSHSGGLEEVALHRRSQPGRLSAMVRGDLDWIVMRALDKDRARRYDTTSALAADIVRHLSGEAVEAAPPSAAYRTRKFVRRHRGVVTACAAVLLTMLVGAGASMVFAMGQSRERKAADEARRVAVDAEQTAATRAAELAKVVEFQSRQLKSVDPQQMGVTLRAGLLERLRTEARRSGLKPSDIDATVAALDQTLARTDFTGLALESVERSFFQPAIRSINETFTDQPLVRSRMLQTTATTMQGLGLRAGALGPQLEALSIRERELGDSSPDTLDSLMELGLLHVRLQSFEAAEPLIQRARSGCAQQFGAAHAMTLRAETCLGYLRQQQGRHAEARAIFEQVLPVQQRVLGDLHVDTIATLSVIGMLCGDNREYAQAELMLRDALAKRRETLGADHPDTIQSLNNLGTLLFEVDRLGEAEVLLSQALEGRRRLLGDDHPETMTSANNLGVLLRMQHRFGEAERIFRETLERRRRVLGEWHAETIDSLSGVGVLLMDVGKRAEADRYLREALDKSRRALGNHDRRTVVCIVNLAELVRSQGRGDEAEFLFSEALRTRQRTRGDANPATLGTRARLGRLLVEVCKYADALRVLQEGEEAARLVLRDEDQFALGRYLIDMAWARIGLEAFDAAEVNLHEAQAMGIEQKQSYGYRAELFRAFVALNEHWHTAHPELGRDAQARQWRAKLDELVAPAGNLP